MTALSSFVSFFELTVGSMCSLTAGSVRTHFILLAKRRVETCGEYWYMTLCSKRKRHSACYHIFCSLLFLLSAQPHHRCWPQAQCCSFLLQEWTEASWLTGRSAQQDLAKQTQIRGLAVSPSESLSTCVSLLCLNGTCSLWRSARARMVCSRNDKERLMYTASFNVWPFDWKVHVTLMKKMTYDDISWNESSHTLRLSTLSVIHPQPHPSLSQPLWPSQIYQIQFGGDILGIWQRPWVRLWMRHSAVFKTYTGQCMSGHQGHNNNTETIKMTGFIPLSVRWEYSGPWRSSCSSHEIQ